MKTIQNWSGFITLLIAVFGGIPGIISLIIFLRKRIIFGFKLEGLMTGQFKSKNMILITGIVTNKSEKPLTPATYDLNVKIDKKWVRLERTVIPENSVFESKTQNIKFDKPEDKDLLKIKQSVTSSFPVYGHLLFLTDKISIEVLQNEKYNLKLVCIDIFGKKYTVKFSNDNISTKINEPTSFPKHGVLVSPKS